MDCHPLWTGDPEQLKDELERLALEMEIIPVLTCPESVSAFVHPGSPFRFVALKGREGWGLVGSESLSLLFSLFREKAGPQAPKAVVWGGLARPEAVAAYLACGAAGVVFERLTLDRNGAGPEVNQRLAKIRPEQAVVLGSELGLPLRLFDKGISPAVARLRQAISALDPKAPDLKSRFRKLVGLDESRRPGEAASAQNFHLAGPEEAFAASFGQRFGTEPALALAGFRTEIFRSWEQARTTWDRFLDSPLRRDFSQEYPFVQGAMAWITDNPEFALAVSQAGGLPTISLGLRDRAGLERDLAGLNEKLEGRSFAVNLLTLPENANLEEQLDWIENARPDLTVMVGFNKALVRRLQNSSLKVACLATDKDNMALALRSGVDYLILEGNEAGGHVGSLSTLTLAQAALELREEQSELFSQAKIILAGGVVDQETAFRAAMLGAQGVQMGTAYLATEEITATGSLSPLYQEMIIAAQPGRTVVTGESLGLSVRALDTAKIRALQSLEKEMSNSGLDESEARLKVERMVAGSLFVAARSRPNPGEAELDRESCLAQGQFLAGAGAGLVREKTTLSQLHRSLAGGSFRPAPPPALKPRANGPTVIKHDSPERIAITGMALSNALGNSVERIWEASLAMESGITEVSLSRWDHRQIYDPNPRAANKTYCRFGAFQSVDISRKELGIPPHDFRTMSDSTRLTLWLADRALKDSGLLDSGLPPERIGVIVSQNSGEASARLRELIVNFQAPRFVEAVQEIVSLDPGQAAALEKRLRSMGLEADDTTLLGRLNCAAGGFISNKYGFRGPCFAVTAACATGLVALYNALNLIRNGIIDAAVVGGGEENLSQAHYLEFSALGALASISGADREPRESSRPFDAGRDGMVLGEGGGLVIIERESAARARGAEIKAFITSMGASNNDQGMVESLAETQVLALKAAFDGPACSPEQIGLVECHATSTSLGDREEVKALKSIFPQGDGPVLAAFKSQIGHTLGASGLNGLIRAAAALREGILPGTLNYGRPDPEIDLEGWGFKVLPEPELWPRRGNRPRRALVNAFGFGGANYVVTLEENRDGSDRVSVALPGKTPKKTTEADAVLAGLSFYRIRSMGREIRAAAALERSPRTEQMLLEAGESLFDPAPKTGRRLAGQGIYSGADLDGPPPLALVIAGQGTYYPGMGREIYRSCEPVKKTMDRIAALAGYDLLGLLFSQEENGLRHTRWQQPALFALEYALARYLLDLGIAPAALAGHSLGELVALCLAGVYSLKDGFGIVDKRAKCMAKAAEMADDPGAMLAVDPRQPELKALVEEAEGVYYTNYNSPAQAVLGGPTRLVLDLQERLAQKGLRATRLKVSMAFHSPLMEVIRDEMAGYVGRIEFRPPRIPVLSNTTGLPYPDDPEEIRAIIMAHLEAPVLWQQNVETLQHDFGVGHFVEIGPRDTLSAFIADTLSQAVCFQVCSPQAEVSTLRSTLARLYCHGCLSPAGTPSVIDLPGQNGQALPAGAPLPRNAGLDGLVQREINQFILDRFGDLIKPAVVAEARRNLGAGFSAQDLENHLRGAELPRPGTVPSSPGQHPRKDRPDKDQPQEHYLEEVIRIIMEATGYDRNEIEPDMDLRQRLAIRSSRFPVIIDSAERTFGITIEWTDFIDVRTVRELADRVAQVAQKSANGSQAAAQTPKPGPTREKPAPLPEIEFSPEDREDLEPPLRVAGHEVPLNMSGATPLDLPRGGTVALLAPAGSETASRMAGHLTRKLGLRILNIDYKDPSKDLADPEGAARAADLIRETEEVAGLILVLDGREPDRLDRSASAFLRGCFTALKSFLERPEKVFCLTMLSGPDQPDRTGIVFQGLAGIFLTAALEYNSVLFGALALDQATDPVRALDSVLTQPRKPVQVAFRNNQAFTPGDQGQTLDTRSGRRSIPQIKRGGGGLRRRPGRHLPPGRVPGSFRPQAGSGGPFRPGPPGTRATDQANPEHPERGRAGGGIYPLRRDRRRSGGRGHGPDGAPPRPHPGPDPRRGGDQRRLYPVHERGSLQQSGGDQAGRGHEPSGRHGKTRPAVSWSASPRRRCSWAVRARSTTPAPTWPWPP